VVESHGRKIIPSSSDQTRPTGRPRRDVHIPGIAPYFAGPPEISTPSPSDVASRSLPSQALAASPGRQRAALSRRGGCHGATHSPSAASSAGTAGTRLPRALSEHLRKPLQKIVTFLPLPSDVTTIQAQLPGPPPKQTQLGCVAAPAASPAAILTHTSASSPLGERGPASARAPVFSHPGGTHARCPWLNLETAVEEGSKATKGPSQQDNRALWHESKGSPCG
jgi:hypothetical protein